MLKAPHPVQGKARAGSSDTEAATTTSPCPSPRRAAGGGGALPPYVTRQLELAAANHAAGWPFSRLLRSVSVPVGGGRPGPDRERLSQTTAGGSIDREVSQPVPVIARRRLCTHPADVTVTSRSQLATRMYIYIYICICRCFSGRDCTGMTRGGLFCSLGGTGRRRHSLAG